MSSEAEERDLLTWPEEGSRRLEGIEEVRASIRRCREEDNNALDEKHDYFMMVASRLEKAGSLSVQTIVNNFSQNIWKNPGDGQCRGGALLAAIAGIRTPGLF